MRTLARPIGLGLAARGDVDDVVDWARRARDAGLDSVWIHDCYFERDAISFVDGGRRARLAAARRRRCRLPGRARGASTRSPATRSCWR